MSYRDVLLDPVVDNNPITLQILGVCSALAVTRSMWPALVMAVAVTLVLVYANGVTSLLRRTLPNHMRLVLEMTLIASAVIIVDEALKAFAPSIAATLSVFVGLIITNCIVLGRVEAFARNSAFVPSLLDGLGNGLGYGLVLLAVAFARELLGAGTLFGKPVSDAAWTQLVPNQFMALPASAFFIVALIIWAIRALKPEQVEDDEFGERQP